jgi:hypothetical protein
MATDDSDAIEFRIGREEIVLRRRYELLSIVNDILVAVWFIVGSVLFFWDATTRLGTWMFLAGSIQLLIRPAIRLARHIHITRLSSPVPESRRDF